MKTKLNYLLTLIVSFSFASTLTATPEPLKIGVLLCQTGNCAEWGAPGINGALLAAEEINAAGGVDGRPVELVTEDSAEDNLHSTVTAYRDLRRRGVKVIVGPTWSPAGKALAPIAKSEPDLLMISPSLGIRDFNETGENFFNLWPHDEFGARKMAEFALAQGYRRIAIFSVQQPWSETQAGIFRSEFEKGGGTITVEVAPLPSTRDLRSEASKIVNSHPEAVIFTCFAEQMGVGAAQLDQLGFSGQKLSVLMYETAISSSRGALEGTLYAADTPPTEDFVSKYKARFGSLPGPSADKAYDAVKLIALASRESQSLAPSDIKRQMLATSGYLGASGKITFTAKRAVQRLPEIYTVRASQMGIAFKSEQESMRAQLGEK